MKIHKEIFSGHIVFSLTMVDYAIRTCYIHLNVHGEFESYGLDGDLMVPGMMTLSLVRVL